MRMDAAMAMPSIDAALSVDAEPLEPISDSTACYGAALLRICLAAPPMSPLTVATETVLDTNTSFLCEPRTSHNNLCVVAATTIAVNAPLRATGSRPLVLIATETIFLDSLLDVGSHRGDQAEAGAGADPTVCFDAGAVPPGSGGGGAGGSFGSLGGAGGDGQGAGGQPGLLAGAAELRGGCPGQPGQGASGGGHEGHGGGAVLLIAGTEISAGGGINAAGESGDGATTTMAGGGGGGAGGMIAFDAPRVDIGNLVLATGGGGGEGSGESDMGNRGADPSSVVSAAGGSRGTPEGGDGGDGAASLPARGGSPGVVLGAARAGGGGGGGGNGIVIGPSNTEIGSDVAPPLQGY